MLKRRREFHHVDYDCGPRQKAARGRFLNQEIQLRLEEIDENRHDDIICLDVEEWREKVQELLDEEALMWKAKDEIERPGKDHKWFTVDQASHSHFSLANEGHGEGTG